MATMEGRQKTWADDDIQKARPEWSGRAVQSVNFSEANLGVILEVFKRLWKNTKKDARKKRTPKSNPSEAKPSLTLLRLFGSDSGNISLANVILRNI